MTKLHNTIQESNDLARQFNSARDIAPRCADLRLVISGNVPAGEHPRRYNRPAVAEVAAVVLDADQQVGSRDIVLHRRGGGLKFIKEHHPMYDALSYPVLFPDARPGWSIEMSDDLDVSLKSFVQFHIQKREKPNVLHLSGKLFQQYIVDQYLRVESMNLLYIRHHQVSTFA